MKVINVDNTQKIGVKNVQEIKQNKICGYSPQIGQDGYWYEYNDDLKEFVNTGVKAQGEKGDTGERGETGEKGVTPVKGIDYFTNEEIENAENNIETKINNHLDSLIGNINKQLDTLTEVNE